MKWLSSLSYLIAALTTCLLLQSSFANVATIQCPSLPVNPKNMVNSIAYTALPDPDYPVDTVAVYMCNPGYNILDGETFRTCTANGTWSGEEAICDVAVSMSATGCADIPDPDNGNIEFASDKTAPFEAGTTATYSCSYGYALVGDDSVRVCESEGSEEFAWSGMAPYCEGTCSPVSKISNGVMSYSETANDKDEYSAGSVVTYTCDNGYEIFGMSTRECQSDRMWTGMEPSCQSVCPSLEPIEGGTLLYTADPNVNGNYPYGSLVFYDCKPNMRLNGMIDRKCGSDGEWSGESPTCEVITCGLIPDPPNGKVEFSAGSSEPFDIGTVAEYSCDEGYVLEGDDSVRVCVLDEENKCTSGKWNGMEPVCQPVSCPPLSEPVNVLNITYSTEPSPNYEFMTEAEYMCDEGFMISGGDEVRICVTDGDSPTGVWVGIEPDCIAIVDIFSCPDIPDPENGRIVFAEDNLAPFEIQTTALYECDPGFALVGGDEVRLCVMDDQNGGGIWSGIAPICVAIVIQFCPPLAPLVGGSIVYSDNVNVTVGLGVNATYKCDMEGFGLKGGDEVRTCDPDSDDGNGPWTGEAPTCEPIQCPDIPDPIGGQVIFSNDSSAPFDFGTTAFFQCDPEYIMSGNDSMPVSECVADGNSNIGVWSGTTDITCIPVNSTLERCLTHIYVAGFTSDYGGAGSDSDHGLELTVNGQYRFMPLNNPWVNDRTTDKGDLWKIKMSDFKFQVPCVTRRLINWVGIRYNGDDGWNIDSIATFVRDTTKAFQCLTLDFDKFRWIDNAPGQKRFVLTFAT